MTMQTEPIPEAPVSMTEAEAKEVHQLFVKSFLIFTGVAVVAHILAWAWRPWLPGPNGYSSLMDGVHVAIQHFA
ncbi:light-harvesting antenna LH1, beta subunit [Hyphomicrobiales bacterium BP6-180914]|uniref:Light-harvesting antenna LH1, beta subunit n=2 Tax=Lichenifustis flavocetrariae TaxID=2949735 RepID=A0AA41YRM0_9HYPH|nr:light-harvesting antenna LH1, beta subunit [Lichenifustis flavocetrariae]MCW6507289.1 light-harvesting antenna LH1, beta subunit [Lichenifustis flavocetrariae]